jgi:hypothetical protein
MQTIISLRHIGYETFNGEEREVVRVWIAVTSSSDLPTKRQLNGLTIHEGSRAWSISDSKEYGFTESGGWNEQKNGGAVSGDFVSIKGTVASVDQLPNDAEPGWLYFVKPLGATESDEYIYTDSNEWDKIGSSSISVSIDSDLSTSSANPVQNKVITNALNNKADKATTLSGYGIEDAKIVSGTITLGSSTITPLTQHQDISGKADKATTLSGYGITDAKIVSGTITLGSSTITPLTQHQDISGKADKATTLSGYGITDAKIASGTITLGSDTITPLTQHQDISGKADKVEQEKDRAALIEIVDSGAKNLSQWNSGTATGSGQTIGSQIPFTTSGNLVVSFQSDVSTGYITLGFKNASNYTLLAQQIDNKGTKIQEITLPSGVAYFNIVSSLSANYTNFMICTKAAWDVSHAYQPYRPSYQELYDRLVALENPNP